MKPVVKGYYENFYQDRAIVIFPTQILLESCVYEEPSIADHGDLGVR